MTNYEIGLDDVQGFHNTINVKKFQKQQMD